MPTYSVAFKKKMIARMLGPGGLSATTLGRELRIPQSTLSSWLRKADTIAGMHDPHVEEHTATNPPPALERSAEDKFRLLVAAASLQGDELSAWLRREGLHLATLDQWRAEVLGALAGSSAQRAEVLVERRRVQGLEREIARKDKALAEAAALLVLQKKFRALLGDEDESIGPRSER